MPLRRVEAFEVRRRNVAQILSDGRNQIRIRTEVATFEEESVETNDIVPGGDEHRHQN